MPVTTGTTTGTSAGGSGGMGGGGQNNGLTTGYVGAPGTNNGAWSGDGQNLGLTTTNTWYGNTAFGPAGGFMTGYSSRDPQSLAAAGMGPTMGTYSNFTTPSGQAMFGGALGGQGFNGMNANQAYGAAQNYYQQLRDYAERRRNGEVTSLPLPPMRPVPTSLPPPAMPPVSSLVPGQPAQYYMAGRAAPVNKMSQAVMGPDIRGANVGSTGYATQPTGYANSMYGNPTLGTVGMSSNLGQYGGQTVNRTGKGNL